MARNRPRKLSQTEALLSLIRIERLGSRLEFRKTVRRHVLHGYACFATEESLCFRRGGSRHARCDYQFVTGSGATTPEAAALEISRSRFSRQKRDHDS